MADAPGGKLYYTAFACGVSLLSSMSSLWSLQCRQVYGAATMNNTLCLGIFLLLVHVRKLRWEFSSEVIIILGEKLTPVQALSGLRALCLALQKRPPF